MFKEVAIIDVTIFLRRQSFPDMNTVHVTHLVALFGIASVVMLDMSFLAGTF